MADVNDLLARLKMPSAAGSADARESTATASSASAIHHPQPQSTSLGGQSFASTAPASQSQSAAFAFNSRPSNLNMTSDDRPASERTNNLLNLLKFNRSSASPSPAAQQLPASSGSAHVQSSPSLDPAPAASPRDVKPPSSETPQDSLLRLLNRPQPAKSPLGERPKADTSEGNAAPDKPAQPPPPSATNKQPVFTYVNPFEQLAASSPANQKKLSPHASEVAHDASKSSSSPAPSPLPDGRTRVEALIGIGATSPPPTETVAGALGQVGHQADKEARDAVAEAQGQELSELHSVSKVVSEMEQTTLADATEAVKDVVMEMNEDLKDPNSQANLRRFMPESAATAFEDTINRIAKESIAQEPETALTKEAVQQNDAPAEPQVFQFPMRPFVAIDINADAEPAALIRNDLFLKIAALKREFDQVDRTLASATANFIVYAMLSAKGGGFRVIRQDEGTSKHVFKKMGDSIFNLSISSSKNQGPESILATDVNGSVCWTSVPISDPEQFAQENLESRGFIFPPLPSQDDNTSGAQLKTRAKLSSRHPDFFAVGRGKSIHIIRPEIALNTEAAYINVESREINSERYLAEQCLKIATGKAGKDFTFSEDDTLIASLDKAGRLKFWDIREHVDPKLAQFKPSTYRHVEVKVPLMTLATCAPTEKSWATSVQFFDKERPTLKGSALRYMLVGSKQNHTLHLWDLGLGKPVQEVNFPHSNELDAICSVVYHAKSGILAVGHPTRNSIFFIHISAPRYNLSPNLSQAEYIQRLAEKDKTLAKPESTAIMSGIREVSLSSLGQLRSLEINPVPLATPADEDAILELYIMHSNGVTCFTLTRQEVGSGRDGKPLHPVDAISANRISLGEFKPPPAADDPHTSESSSKPEEPVRKETRESTKAAAKPAPAQPAVKAKIAASPPKSPHPPPATQNTSQAASIRKEVQPVEAPGKVLASREAASPNPVSFAQIAQRAAPDGRRHPSDTASSSAPKAVPVDKDPVAPTDHVAAIQVRDVHSEERLAQSISTALSRDLSDGLASVVSEQLGNLYRRIDEDKRVQEAAGAAKQDAVLRLVSSTLTDNVEKSLARIVATNIQDLVIPSISSTTAEILDRKMSDALTRQLELTVPREVKSALPPVVSRAMQDPEALRAMSEYVSSKISTHVEQVLSATLQNSLAPAIKKMSVETAQKMVGEIRHEIQQQYQQLEIQRRNDAAKIDQLTAMTGQLLGTVKEMAQNQAVVQNEVAKLQSQASQPEQAPTTISRSEAPAAPPRDAELDEIAAMMTTGRFEEGTIKWLQSARQTEIFDKLFVQLSPSYLRSCNQIVTLSVSAAVTSSLNSNTAERLLWLDAALSSIDPRDSEIAGHAPGVMDHLTQRLQEVYMQIAEDTPSNPILGKIHGLVRRVKDMKHTMAQ